ncbi:extracellular solute-binding protein [Amycolatopsis magusensis]|uniref:extracellular solute-binding protein n=1 Tax=Amycolatopsis magusensis TaxID=882444 RepID=UPI003C307217
MLSSLTLLAGTACSAPAEENAVHLFFVPEPSIPAIVEQCNAMANGDYRIVFHELPRDGAGQLESVRKELGESGGADIAGLDVTWTPEFAERGRLAEWTGAELAEVERGVLEGPRSTARWAGEVRAATKNTNVQLLWFDDRLVPRPPSSWDELIDQAARLSAGGKPGHLLVTGAEYEGLVVLYNSMVGSAGGRLLSEDGKSAVVDAGAVAALGTLRALADTGALHPFVAQHREEDIRLAFERGEGAFQVNWPYVYPALAQARPADLPHFRWAPVPGSVPGTGGRATIGGYNLGVRAESARPEVFRAALCLRSPENQKLAAVRDGLPPTLEQVYADTTPLDPARPVDPVTNPSMATAYPMKDTIAEAVREAAPRPATPAYQRVSATIARVLSPPGAIDPERTAATLRTELGGVLG